MINKDGSAWMELSDDGYFEFLNLALSEELLISVFDYLGSDFPAESFLNARQPPVVSLPLKEKERLLELWKY